MHFGRQRETLFFHLGVDEKRFAYEQWVCDVSFLSGGFFVLDSVAWLDQWQTFKGILFLFFPSMMLGIVCCVREAVLCSEKVKILLRRFTESHILAAG